MSEEQIATVDPNDFAGAWAAATAQVEGEGEGEGGAVEENSDSGGAGDVEAKPSPAADKDGAKVSDADGDDAGSEDDDKNEGKVTPAERAGFRAEKRKWKAKQAEQRQAFEQEKAEYAKRFERHQKALELDAKGDVEGAIEALFGRPTKDVIGDIVKIAKGKDPRVDRELAEMRKRMEEQQRKEQQAQLQQMQTQRQQAQEQWAAKNIAEPLKASEETANLADPMFVAQVFREMQAEYDPDEDETIELSEAVERAKKTLMPAYQRLQKIFGDQSALQTESANGAATRSGKETAQKGRKARTVPNSRATSAAAVTNPPNPATDPAAWDRWAIEKMRAAD